MDSVLISKRSGYDELFDESKVDKLIQWASQGLDVDCKYLRETCITQVKSGSITNTENLHQYLIKLAADSIDVDQSDFQWFAGRLQVALMRKKVCRSFEPWSLLEQLSTLTAIKMYDEELMEAYSVEEICEFDQHIDHNRDSLLTYSATKTLESKYLRKNRYTGELLELPQHAYMLISMTLFARYSDKLVRNFIVKKFYDAVSLQKLSLPTPIMAGMRTPTRQFSSCVLIDADDTLDSIIAQNASIIKFISKKAGIGLNGGRYRAAGSEINGGESIHTGLVPFYRLNQAAVGSCSQGGVRKGSATLCYPFWHRDIESLLVLKNNRGTETNRVRFLDYTLQVNRIFYQRYLNGGDFSLFSPDAHPELYMSFFTDQDRFEEIYTSLENNHAIKKTVVPAKDLWNIFMQERAQTGRIYLMNVDHANKYGAFNPAKAPVFMSNLCLEILLPTWPWKAYNDNTDEKAEIALCTLAAFVLGNIDNDEIPELSELVVRALDALLSYQSYELKPAEKHGVKRRSIGVGVTDFAHWLAQRGLSYSGSEGNNAVHELFELIQHSLLTASCKLAKEFGACELFGDTKYADGSLPIDEGRYAKAVDEVHTAELKQDWEALREDIAKYGLRNSTVTALMPCETSSLVSNSTNGIEAPRGAMTIKASKEGTLRQIVPEFKEIGGKYEFKWDQPSNVGYIQKVGIICKFIDQAVSANTNYDPYRYPKNLIPADVIADDICLAYQLGVPTLYYQNTRSEKELDTKAAFIDEDSGCAGGACKI